MKGTEWRVEDRGKGANDRGWRVEDRELSLEDRC